MRNEKCVRERLKERYSVGKIDEEKSENECERERARKREREN